MTKISNTHTLLRAGPKRSAGDKGFRSLGGGRTRSKIQDLGNCIVRRPKKISGPAGAFLRVEALIFLGVFDYLFAPPKR